MLIEFCEQVIEKTRIYEGACIKRLTTGNFNKFSDYKYYAGMLEGYRQSDRALKEVYDFFTSSSLPSKGERAINDTNNQPTN